MEITNTEQLEAYLRTQSISYKSLTQLKGGAANFVWRMLDPSDKSTIIKHAEPYVAAVRHMPWAATRMDFEHRAMTLLPQILPLNDSNVSIPQIHHYDKNTHVMLLSDGGTRTLKQAYTDSTLDIPRCGRELGTWLASLHSRTTATDIGDNQAGTSMSRFSYSVLATSLAKFDFDPAFGEQMNSDYGSLLQSDNDCVCHGDFWPGNVLLREQNLTLVDWEMVRRGCGATDLGQFAAEAFMLDRFRGGRGLLAAFLQGYRACRGEVGWEFFRRCAVHMGAHLVAWPARVLRGSEAEVRECMGLGVEMMRAADEGRREWFREGLLKQLL